MVLTPMQADPAVAYTVDREECLVPGMQLSLTRHTDLDPPALQQHVDDLFPAGVSPHGDRHFLSNAAGALVTEPNIEMIFEYVRRAHFPDCPSRFQCAFGSETLNGARAFRDHKVWGVSRAPIYELHPRGSFRADMTCLTLDQTCLVVSACAHAYWSADRNLDDTVDPMWELLLPLPVIVGDRIE